MRILWRAVTFYTISGCNWNFLIFSTDSECWDDSPSKTLLCCLTYCHGKGVKNTIEVRKYWNFTKINYFRDKTGILVPAEPKKIESWNLGVKSDISRPPLRVKLQPSIYYGSDVIGRGRICPPFAPHQSKSKKYNRVSKRQNYLNYATFDHFIQILGLKWLKFVVLEDLKILNKMAYLLPYPSAKRGIVIMLSER